LGCSDAQNVIKLAVQPTRQRAVAANIRSNHQHAGALQRPYGVNKQLTTLICY